MATEKMVTRGGGKARPDRHSKKRSGILKTSLRVNVADNRLLRKAAKLEGMSQSLWMARVLVAAAKQRIAAETMEVPTEAGKAVVFTNFANGGENT